MLGLVSLLCNLKLGHSNLSYGHRIAYSTKKCPPAPCPSRLQLIVTGGFACPDNPLAAPLL